MTTTLRPNPFSAATVRHRNGKAVELRVWSVTRSRRAMIRNFARGTRPDFDRLCAIATASCEQSTSARSIEDFVVLTALGLWAPESELLEPIHYEAPITCATTVTPTSDVGDFMVRGEIWLQTGRQAGPLVPDIALSCLSPRRPILWHKGSDIEPPLPWWPDAGCLAAIDTMRRGAPLSPAMLPALQALAEQGIVARRPEASPRTPPHPFATETARDAFARNGFVDLGRILPPGQVETLRAYWRRLAALDVLPRSADQPSRSGCQGEPTSVLLLHLLHPLIARVVGADIEPSYSLAWTYNRGTKMPPHRDREACRYTVTLLADFAPAVEGPTPWPVCIQPRDDGSPLEFHQSVGDALLFAGQELVHFRPPFTTGERSTSLLLHYVDTSFSGVLF
jgi:hypothetical protein